MCVNFFFFKRQISKYGQNAKTKEKDNSYTDDTSFWSLNALPSSMIRCLFLKRQFALALLRFNPPRFQSNISIHCNLQHRRRRNITTNRTRGPNPLLREQKQNALDGLASNMPYWTLAFSLFFFFFFFFATLIWSRSWSVSVSDSIRSDPMAGAASALFLLDIKGRVLIWRDYRGDVSAVEAERFFTKLIEKEVHFFYSAVLIYLFSHNTNSS